MKNYKLMHFNFKKFEDKYLIINDVGDYDFLEKKDFQLLLDKNLDKESLLNKFYFYEYKDLEPIIKKYRKSKGYLEKGTSLFIVVLTNRCNQNCIYCQASRKCGEDKKLDMNYDTAQKTVDLILQSPNKNITIEFQGGEPLLNFEVLKFIVEKVRLVTGKLDKSIDINVVSNILLLEKGMLDFLIKTDVKICTSLDGDRYLHNKNRPVKNEDSYNKLMDKLKFINDEYKNMNIKGKVNAIQTTTKMSLDQYKQIIDTYISLGLNSIYLRPLNPFGFAEKLSEIIGYSSADFLNFYEKALTYIIEINKGGKLFIEGTAQIYLSKIFQKYDMNHMEIRSPCGAVIGQMAINYDGNIYTCDEGRMMAETGCDLFKIGNVNDTLYKDLYQNDVTKVMCMSSCTEAFPRCYQCPYSCFCGICPIVNKSQEGDIFKNNANRCLINEGILDILFKYVKSGDKEVLDIFKKRIG